MKNFFFLCALLVVYANSYAKDSFKAREAMAARLESTAAGQTYWMELQDQLDAQNLNKIQGACFGGGEPGTTEEYTLIADVVDGSFNNVAVQPENERSTCVAERFKQLEAPALPREFQKSGFPIVIHVTHKHEEAP